MCMCVCVNNYLILSQFGKYKCAPMGMNGMIDILILNGVMIVLDY